MYVVSGCPRNGTTLCMRIMESGLGPDRILKAESPKETKKPELSEIQKYLRDKMHPNFEKRQAIAADMNPHGYYEMAFCVRGIKYSQNFEHMLSEIETGTEPPKAVKVVSQGLAQSDPRYIGKIVYMVRNPWSVAKSQERLMRQNPMSPEDAPEVDGKKVLIRSVKMYNQVSFAAARWLVKHPSIPVHVVEYDELIDTPKTVIRGIADFIGDGDFSEAHNIIDTGLRRSKPERPDDDRRQVETAERLYPLLKAGDFAGVCALQESILEEIKVNPPKPTQWHCPRLGHAVNVHVCELCASHPQTTANLRKSAEKRNVDWEGEPCPYECGVDGSQGMSVAESIARNHWALLDASTP